MSKNKTTNKLNLPAFALGLGVTWSLAILCAGWMAMFDWGSLFVKVMASIYIGYEPTFIGGLVGALWALFDGAIGGLVFAFFYNLFAPRINK